MAIDAGRVLVLAPVPVPALPLLIPVHPTTTNLFNWNPYSVLVPVLVVFLLCCIPLALLLVYSTHTSALSVFLAIHRLGFYK